MTKKIVLVTSCILILLFGVYLVNASWLARAPDGEPTIFSHRGVYQIYDRENLGRDDCTATRIYSPTHDFLENTIRSMLASFEYGADVLELDVHPTTDGEFVVFHDWTLECRTEGTGVTREHDLAYLQSLDIGYGYTADGGKTYPFRGRGIGLMPTLNEVFTTFPDKQFLINIKSNRPKESETLYAYAKEHGLFSENRPLMVYGGDKATDRMREIASEALVPNRTQVVKCAKEYMLYGWTSFVPSVCKNTAILIPMNKTHFFWGWPNRFLQRMEDANTIVMILGSDTDTGGIPGVKTIEELEKLPKGFDGGIWVESIETLGPYIKENFGSDEG